MARRAFARTAGPRFIKRWLPTSLWGRSLLIIVLPVAVMQIAVSFVFFNAHWERVTTGLSAGLAGEIAWIMEDYRRDPSPAAFDALAERAQATLNLSLVRQPGAGLPLSRRAPSFADPDRLIRRALAERISAPFWLDTTRYDNFVDIRVKVDDGVLRILANKEHAFATKGWNFLLWVAGATLILTAVAVLFIRNQIRAIERLAEAADIFGRGGDVSTFKPYGAREVRQAARAFFDMKDRIQRHIDQRTALLASVSHDLRTPLTRLKLELALSDSSPRITAMDRDLSEMEHMIDEYLAFASGEGGEAAQAMALAPIVEAVADGARRAGADVAAKVEPDLAANVRPNALRRALTNLVENAASHAKKVRIIAQTAAKGGAEIMVDDDGPGIAAERREDAFKPFNRLDESRNQNRKGVGLGLAIARDVARAHGGDVILETSPLGGLRARVWLPG